MIWVLGGDVRSYWAVQALREQGYSLHTHQVPHLTSEPLPEKINCLILPFPSFSGDCVRGTDLTVQALAPILGEHTRVYGGCLSALCEACGAECIDLYDSEPLTTLNAAATAEGAIALAITYCPITIQNARCLVIGAGRIGKLLAQRLHLLGAEVCLTARKPADHAYAEACGLRTDVTGEYRQGLGQYDMVFNTVPSPVLAQEQLLRLSPECVLFELASSAGYSQEDCQAIGLRSIVASGLPGRFSPKTAGLLYAKSIREREECV